MMHESSFTQSEGARRESLEFIKSSMDSGHWHNHKKIVEHFRHKMKQHVLFSHPILVSLTTQKLDMDSLKFIHLNYLNSIVKIFTDALSMLVFLAKDLENNKNIHKEQRIVAKVYARYLLSLNLFDELGFNTYDLAQSSPAKSHLAYYMHLLEGLSISPFQQADVQPEAQALSSFITKHYDNYASLLLILALTEKQVIVFSEALRRNVCRFDERFGEGYYACHGLANDGTNLANDDNHEDDIWTLLIQAIDEHHTGELGELIQFYLDLWQNFWTVMDEKTKQMNKPQI